MKSINGILYQLSRPISYVFIRHNDKYLYDWALPTLLALLVLSSLGFWVDDWAATFRLVDGIADFVQSLPGFFIAALAAIATFNRADIDKTMDGRDPPSIHTRINNNIIDVKLTRRRFLCLLFSYLTVESFIISILGIASVSIGFLDESNNLVHSIYVTWLFVSVFVFLSCQMLISTLHGLYYLAERVHY